MIGLVQQATIVTGTPWSGSATATISFPGNLTPGNFVAVVFTLQSNRSVVGVTDGGNTYATDASVSNIAGPGQELWIYWAPVTSAQGTISIELDTSNGSLGFIKAWEFSEIDNDDMFEDGSSLSSGVAITAWNSGAVTTAIADSLIVGILSTGNFSLTGDDDYETEAIGQAGCDGLVGYKILTATEAAEEWNVTLGGGGASGAIVIAAFNGLGGGVGPTLPWLPRQTNLSGPTGAQMLPGGMRPPNKPS